MKKTDIMIDVANIEKIQMIIRTNIDVIKSIIQTLADETGAEYEVMIENLVEEIRSPLK